MAGRRTTEHRRRISATRVALALAFIVLCGCLRTGGGTPGRSPRWSAEGLPGWEAAFQQADTGWRGADGDASVALAGSRILWLFGDTWITSPHARVRQGGQIVRNSLAIEDLATGRPGKIGFYWRENAENPRAAFRPKGGTGWLWPLSGVRLGQTLLIFFVQVVDTANTEQGFELSGSVLARVSNPDDPPSEWRVDPCDIPFFRHGPEGDTVFGSACLSLDGLLYMYGYREDWKLGPQGRHVLLARAPTEAVTNADFSDWQFFTGGAWSRDLPQASPLFDGAATEMSVSWFPAERNFIAVYSYCGLSPNILCRTALRPEGPWSGPTVLYECPEASWNPNYFCYGGKAHPELATMGNELIVTYSANAWDLDDLREDLRLYWPRFIRVVRQ
jgi:hypothetical protein